MCYFNIWRHPWHFLTAPWLGITGLELRIPFGTTTRTRLTEQIIKFLYYHNKTILNIKNKTLTKVFQRYYCYYCALFKIMK